MNRVDGKVVLVTGGASGLGAAVARRFAAEGACVVVTDLDAAAGGAVAEDIGGDAHFLSHDVRKEEEWIAVIAAAAEHFAPISVLVNCAGVAILRDVEATTLEEWRDVMAVNLDGVFLGCKHGVIAMKETGGGSIINMSSVSGLIGGYNLAAYNASKGGVRLLTKSVALHCARQKYAIRCNSVHPSFVDTPMVRAMIDGSRNPERTEKILKDQIPLGRLGHVDDVAAMVLYLASDESSFVTGAEMVVDGGLTA
jgi:3(or 17)beta-hydroxysteroid dehydrogenase